MRAADLLDDMILKLGSLVPKFFLVSTKIYLMLCDELNRNARTYKGIKVKPDTRIKEDMAYLIPKND